jgi:hypothetical protein
MLLIPPPAEKKRANHKNSKTTPPPPSPAHKDFFSIRCHAWEPKSDTMEHAMSFNIQQPPTLRGEHEQFHHFAWLYWSVVFTLQHHGRFSRPTISLTEAAAAAAAADD